MFSPFLHTPLEHYNNLTKDVGLVQSGPHHLIDMQLVLVMSVKTWSLGVKQQSITIYNKVVLLVICDGWHFTCMWKAFAWPHHFTKRGGLSHKTSLTSTHFIEVSVPGQEGSGHLFVFLSQARKEAVIYLCFCPRPGRKQSSICVLGYKFYLFLRLIYWIFELFWQLVIFFFPFITHSLTHTPLVNYSNKECRSIEYIIYSSMTSFFLFFNKRVIHSV